MTSSETPTTYNLGGLTVAFRLCFQDVLLLRAFYLIIVMIRRAPPSHLGAMKPTIVELNLRALFLP